MALFDKCDFCSVLIEEGKGFICKCSYTDIVCAQCAGSGMNKCPICDVLYQAIGTRTKTRVI